MFACGACGQRGYLGCACSCAACKGGGTVVQPCRACNGAPIRCPDCAGSRQVACRSCDGLGYFLKKGIFRTSKSRCPQCEGRGSFECTKCRRGQLVCTQCHGQQLKVKCPACSGGSGDTNCQKCHGTKRVTCDTCIGGGRVNIDLAILELEEVPNSFSSNNDDERMEDYEEPYSILSRLQVDRAVARFLNGTDGVVWRQKKCLSLNPSRGGPTLSIYGVSAGYALKMTTSHSKYDYAKL
jgi:hypothetical protein